MNMGESMIVTYTSTRYVQVWLLMVQQKLRTVKHRLHIRQASICLTEVGCYGESLLQSMDLLLWSPHATTSTMQNRL